MNRAIVSDLERLRSRYDEQGDSNRERAYRNAISSVLECRERLQNGKDAMRLKGIGKGIGWRIDQVLGTDTVGPKDSDSPKPKSKQSGKSPSGKIQWPQESKAPKRRTTKQQKCPSSTSTGRPRLRANFVGDRSTTTNNDSQGRRTRTERQPKPKSKPKPTVRAASPARLPRDIADKLLDIVRRIALQTSSESHVALVDEYRRQLPELTHLVFLITERSLPKSVRRGRGVLQAISEQLQRAGLLVDVHHTAAGTTVVNGKACFRTGHQLPIWFICVPALEWPFALLKYTGPNHIWVQLQLAASAHGFELTEKRLTNGFTPIPARTEREILSLLKVKYIPPQQRH